MYTISRSVLHRHHLARDPFTITPAKKGPRRLAFRIRRRGFTFEGSPSLLIINPYGVWSVTRDGTSESDYGRPNKYDHIFLVC
jgi:hypothetical protein